MARDEYDATEVSTHSEMASYAVEIQFFDTSDRPDAQVTLPLMQFFNQNVALGSNAHLGRWLK